MSRLAQLTLEENFALAALRQIITTSTEPARITAAANAILRFCTQARREERAMQELLDSQDEEPTDPEDPDDNDFDPDDEREDDEPINIRPSPHPFNHATDLGFERSMPVERAAGPFPVAHASGQCSSNTCIKSTQSPQLTTSPNPCHRPLL